MRGWPRPPSPWYAPGCQAVLFETSSAIGSANEPQARELVVRSEYEQHGGRQRRVDMDARLAPPHHSCGLLGLTLRRAAGCVVDLCLRKGEADANNGP